VRGLTLSDVRLLADKPDGRHALVLDDVEEANISGLSCSHAASAPAVVRMAQAGNVLIRGCQPLAADGVFLRLEGPDTAGIALLGNDFSRVGKVAEFGEGVDPAVLRSSGNVEPKP
jgi:hypothetical protein